MAVKKKKVLFVVNPLNKRIGKKNVNRKIIQGLDPSRLEWEIVFTEGPGHGTAISRDAAGSYDGVIAVGGDGTVNEVFRGLVGSPTAMGIVPCGSGNGLARSLEIPMKIRPALEMINAFYVHPIDSLSINDTGFINLAGIGFDAHIAHLFSKSVKRGFLSYLCLAWREFFSYQPMKCSFQVDGTLMQEDVIQLSFANSSQFGNNVHIAPLALVDDGLIDVCWVKEMPSPMVFWVAFQMFNRSVHKSRYHRMIQGESIVVEGTETWYVNVDGEPMEMKGPLEIKIHPKSINMIVRENLP